MKANALPQEIIRKKRDGASLSHDELAAFVAGVTSGDVSEAQIAAFSMAVFFQDLTVDERVALTLAVRDSGRVLSWDSESLGGPVLDKHSTGGVGDTVSLMLAPMLAACGAYVPMIAGRGLAHTGGTIDKLEAIPGYQTGVTTDQFQRVVQETGFAIVRQTDDLAPADRRMYATRDVTATVEHLGLITASIVSKKLCAGLDHLVLDVKSGNGAVMQSLDDAVSLAQSMVDVGNGAGMPTQALVTDMSVPLAWSAGNAVEVQEAVDYLRGEGARHPRLDEVVLALGSRLLVAGGLENDLTAAEHALVRVRDDGSALERMANVVEKMGGDPRVTERPEQVLGRAPVVKPLQAPHGGKLTGFDVRGLGMAVVALGGGRTIPDAAIDPRVGLSKLPLAGTTFEPGDPLLTIHASDDASWQMAADRILRTLRWDEDGWTAPALIHEQIEGRRSW